MPEWVWYVIAAAVVIAIVLAVWRGLAARRTKDLRGQFGPEYDRAAESAGSKRQAEADLAARQERRAQLNIRPLAPESRARYADQWRAVQSQFVDSPAGAVSAADTLVSSVMADRGYPMDDFDQRAADVSVDHPQVAENYRNAHDVSLRSDQGDATTEDLRQAMQHYRALFDELLDEDSADRPLAREEQDADQPARERTVR